MPEQELVSIPQLDVHTIHQKGSGKGYMSLGKISLDPLIHHF
jgi:hypothetical protein